MRSPSCTVIISRGVQAQDLPIPGHRFLLGFGPLPFDLYNEAVVLDMRRGQGDFCDKLDKEEGPISVTDRYQHDQSDERSAAQPVLFVDVDGVISLFGFREGYGLAPGDVAVGDRPTGELHSINGILHYISSASAGHLRRLAEHFELVWASGWEEAANDYLPHLLELDGHLPYLTFDGRVSAGPCHWKIEAVDEYARGRPAAWIDDNLNEECHDWADNRGAPTLLIETERHEGMTDQHVERLLRFVEEITGN